MTVKIMKLCIAKLNFFFSLFAIISLFNCGSEQAFTTTQIKLVDLHCELPKLRKQIMILDANKYHNLRRMH